MNYSEIFGLDQIKKIAANDPAAFDAELRSLAKTDPAAANGMLRSLGKIDPTLARATLERLKQQDRDDNARRVMGFDQPQEPQENDPVILDHTQRVNDDLDRQFAELDAATEQAITVAKARADSYEAQPVTAAPALEPSDLAARSAAMAAQNVLVKAARHKIERDKVERKLKKYDLTLADLPADFWDHDRDERDRILAEIIAPAKAKARDAKRLEKKITGPVPRGWYLKPPSPFDAERLVSGTARTAKWRAKKVPPAPAPQPTVRPIPATTISRAWRDDKLATLKSWTAGTGSSARKFRGREAEMVQAAGKYHSLSAELRRQPSLAEFAARLGRTRRAAQNRIDALEMLYSAAGPWQSVTSVPDKK